MLTKDFFQSTGVYRNPFIQYDGYACGLCCKKKKKKVKKNNNTKNIYIIILTDWKKNPHYGSVFVKKSAYGTRLD